MIILGGYLIMGIVYAWYLDHETRQMIKRFNDKDLKLMVDEAHLIAVLLWPVILIQEIYIKFKGK